MRRPAAGLVGARRIDRAVPLFDVGDFPFLVDHEGRAVRYAGILIEHAIRSGGLAFGKIAQKRHGNVVFSREFALRRGIIGANSKNFDVVIVEFCNTSLVCQEFLRSATGERGGVKRQDDRVFATEIRQLHLSALGGVQVEIGRHVTDLQVSFRRLDGLPVRSGRNQHAEQS